MTYKPTEEQIVMGLFAEHCQNEAIRRKQNPLTKKIEQTANLVSKPIEDELIIERKPFVLHISEDAIIAFSVIGFFAFVILILLIFGV